MELVTLQITNAVATICINRPSALNALNTQVLNELADLAKQMQQRSDIQVVVLAGAGEKAFVAGADIKEMAAFTPEQASLFSRTGAQVFACIAELPQVVIAKVQGFALGGGLEFALCADFIYASTSAKFGLPEVGLGLIPGFGGTQRLSQRIGVARALEWVTTANKYTAQQAYEVGLVNCVLEPENLEPAVELLAQKICAQGPLAVRAAKFVMTQSNRKDLGLGYGLESSQFGLRFQTSEFKEGVGAFLEKRSPKFGG